MLTLSVNMFNFTTIIFDGWRSCVRSFNKHYHKTEEGYDVVQEIDEW